MAGGALSWRVGLAAFAVCLFGVAPAAWAGVVQGSANDPIDDSSGLESTDITHVLAVYDDTGKISASVAFRDPPAASDDAVVSVIFGAAVSGQSCTNPSAGIVGPSAGGGTVSWERFDAAGNPTGQGQDGTESTSGQTTTLTVSDPGLAGGRFACAEAEIAAPDPFDPSTPQTLDSVGAFAVAPPAPSLVLVTTIPVELGRGESRTARIVVANTGDLAARTVAVTITAGHGLKVSQSRLSLGTLAPSAVARRTVRVTLSRRARARIPVSVTATGGGSTAHRQLRIGRPPPALARPRAGSLGGRYFWRTQINPEQSWDNQGIAFIDDHWAYRGFPPHGVPQCPAAGRAKAGGDGCVHYSYNARTGRLNVAGQSGRYSGGTLTLGTDGYLPLVIPPAGALYDVSLIQLSTVGLCPGSCTTTTNYLSLTTDGLFSLGGSIAGSIGSPGGVFTSGFGQSPDQYGTYEIDRRGQIRLMFASGRVEIETIGIQTDRAGHPAPQNAGVLIGATNYYPSR